MCSSDLFAMASSRCDPALREEAIAKRIPELLTFLLRHLATATSFAPRPDPRRCAYCDYRPACGAAMR